MREQLRQQREAIISLSRNLGLGEPFPTSMNELVVATEKTQKRKRDEEDQVYRDIKNDRPQFLQFNKLFHSDKDGDYGDGVNAIRNKIYDSFKRPCFPSLLTMLDLRIFSIPRPAKYYVLGKRLLFITYAF